MDSQELSPLKKLISEITQIYKKIQNSFDWENIDKNESLTFLHKNYHMKPSDIARKLLYLIAFVFYYIEGFRTLTILMCYLLPIGIMILNICQVLKTKKKKSLQNKHKLNQSELEEKSSLEKNESILSINSKQNDTKIQSPPQQEGKTQNPNNSLSSNTNSNQSQKATKGLYANDSETTLNQLCKIFILYFIVNLTIELSEPLLLLILQTTFSIGQVLLTSVQELIFEGNFWVLLLLPFRFISTFFVQIFYFTGANTPSKIALIIFRVFLSAFLLNLNPQQVKFCTKFVFEQKIKQLPFQLASDQKPKKPKME